MIVAVPLLATFCLAYPVGLWYGKGPKGSAYRRLGLLCAGLIAFGRILGAW
ncbi:MAG: hypothetical protein JO321_10430 [Solirubrobacterales bacterium]|nr:hypothetical protein [Solirubrobacterales bacterium]MBV9166059.1 hypothetical protein [Solirubrobacterales bacterium]MBV9535814.1 hypothetical protein [Solirubrobacterales bacterium]